MENIVIYLYHFIYFQFPETPILTVGDIERQEQQGNAPKIVPIPPRNPLIYTVVHHEQQVVEEVDDSFYDLTVTEAKRLQKQLAEDV